MNATRSATIALITLLTAAGCAQTETDSGATPGVEFGGAAAVEVAPTTTAASAAEPPTTAEAPESEPTSPPVEETDPEPESETETEPTSPPVEETDPDPIVVVPVTIKPIITIPSPPPLPPFEPPVPAATIPPVFAVPAAPDCDVFGDIPGNASGVETMMIDVDDDGADDTVTTYFAAIGDSAGWRLRTQFADGLMDDIAIAGVGPGAAKILGAVQVDHTVVDPATWAPELLVQAGANSSGPNLTVYGLDGDGCLFRFEDEAGTDLVIPIHASIGTMSGLRCDAVSGHQFLVALEAEHTAGSMYAATETILDRSGQALVPSTVIQSEIDGDSNGDWLNQFGDLNCGSVTI